MIARNAPCPCGSGRKYKLCCGTTRAEERAFARRIEWQAEVLAEVMRLPTEFPRLRPEGEAFSAWVDDVAADDPLGASVKEGIARLEPKERRRIERTHAKEFPAVWHGFCDELGGDEEVAREAVVAGAVVAALNERQPPDADTLALLEESDDLLNDPCEALVFALQAGDLWSVYESIQVDEALRAIPEALDDEAYDAEWNGVVRAQAARLRSRWHDKRLKLLVGRLRARLPLADYPRSSSALLAACEAFERDDAMRRRLAELLLADSLSWMRVGLPAAA